MALGRFVYRKQRDRGLSKALGAALLPLSALVILWSWLTTIGIDPVVGPWNHARLAPAMSLRQGYALYSPPGSGPVTGWIYPPLATLAYLPATLIPDPTSTVLAGRCLSLVYFFAPAAWLLMTDRTDRTRWTGSAGALLFAGFALLSAQSRPLRYCSTEIHADAPALGSAAVAAGLIARAGPRIGRGARPPPCSWPRSRCGPSTLTAPVLLIVLPFWAYLTGGLKGLLRVIAMAIAGGLGISIVLLAAFDTWHTIFNIVNIPLLHPRRMEAITWAVWNLMELEQRQILLLLVLAAGGLGLLTRKSHERRSGGGLISEPWALFLLVAVAEFPLSLMAYLKVGGDDNNLGFMLYFLTLAGFLMHARLNSPWRAADEVEPASPSFRGILVLTFVLTLFGRPADRPGLRQAGLHLAGAAGRGPAIHRAASGRSVLPVESPGAPRGRGPALPLRVRRLRSDPGRIPPPPTTSGTTSRSTRGWSATRPGPPWEIR